MPGGLISQASTQYFDAEEGSFEGPDIDGKSQTSLETGKIPAQQDSIAARTRLRCGSSTSIPHRRNREPSLMYVADSQEEDEDENTQEVKIRQEGRIVFRIPGGKSLAFNKQLVSDSGSSLVESHSDKTATPRLTRSFDSGSQFGGISNYNENMHISRRRRRRLSDVSDEEVATEISNPEVDDASVGRQSVARTLDDGMELDCGVQASDSKVERPAREQKRRKPNK